MNEFDRLDLETGRRAPVLKVTGPALEADVSADNRWVAYTTGTAISVGSLGAPDVYTVAEDRRLVNSPRWSPDGSLLYYVSFRDGWSCLWAQRLDPITKKPRGSPLWFCTSTGVPGFGWFHLG